MLWNELIIRFLKWRLHQKKLHLFLTEVNFRLYKKQGLTFISCISDINLDLAWSRRINLKVSFFKLIYLKLWGPRPKKISNCLLNSWKPEKSSRGRKLPIFGISGISVFCRYSNISRKKEKFIKLTFKKK